MGRTDLRPDITKEVLEVLGEQVNTRHGYAQDPYRSSGSDS